MLTVRMRTNGRLHALPIHGLRLERDMYVIWDKRRALTIPARLFVDLLESSKETGKEPAS